MTQSIDALDHFGTLIQAGEDRGVRLVRLTGVSGGNRYTARPIEFDSDGAAQIVGEATLLVTNLAEPADQTGQVACDTDAVALDTEGRWVVFVRPASDAGAAAFPAKVTASQGGAVYTVREQALSPVGVFSDAPGAADLTARNLAELSLGPGGAVDDGAIVLVTTVTDTGEPPTLRYVFDHPAYAKYLS